jgi:hypothetical protein
MKIIKIKKSGKMFVQNKSIKSLKEHLLCEVEFDEGLTFGTFLKLVLNDKEFFETVFYQELNGMKLIDFEKKLKEKPTDKKSKLEFLEISKVFELISINGENTIDLFSIFIGIGEDDGEKLFPITVSSYSVNELKNLKLILNRTVGIFKEVEDNKQYYESKISPIIEAESIFSLYEIIQSIFFEISFYTNDKDRIASKQTEDNQCKIEDTRKFLKTKLDSYVKNDEYEKAEVVKKELDKLKNIS